MLKFCNEIESDRNLSRAYKEKTRNLAKWYQDTFHTYAQLLKTETGMEAMAQQLDQAHVFHEDLLSMSYVFNAKLSCFCVADALLQLILAKYAKGPSKTFFERYHMSCSLYGEEWSSCHADVNTMVEIVARVLGTEPGHEEVVREFSIDLRTLVASRSDRNEIAHKAAPSKCLSAMRVYNILRDMFILLDPDYESTLPAFDLPDEFDYDHFVAPPNAFGFEERTTILVVDSVHDVRSEFRAAVANLPWDVVIDLDGYSEAGGLMSTVSHNCIKKEILCTDTSSQVVSLSPGKTLWLRCGSYQSYRFHSSQKLSIGPLLPFLKNAPNTSEQMFRLRQNLKAVLRKVVERDRPLHFVIVTDDYLIPKNLIKVVLDERISDYFISWIGLCDNPDHAVDWFDNDSDLAESHFQHYASPVHGFYKSFKEYSADWSPRVMLDSQFALPGPHGMIQLKENDRNNLESCFEVLYDNCEKIDPGEVEMQRSAFYRGSRASWPIVAAQDPCRLRRDEDLQKWKNQIKTHLGTVNDTNAQQRLFFVSHTAGIGGSTLVRQIAWDLHTEYAVLSVHTYDRDIRNKIKHLYDDVLDKSPIIVVAEDTSPNFEKLCDDICLLSRRCILLAACRSSNGYAREKYRNATWVDFSSIPDRFVQPLQELYRRVSPLSESEIAVKDRNFSKEFGSSSQNKITPFMVGLYYNDKDFDVDDYVLRVLNTCSRRHADVLAFLAICDKYGQKNVPASFIRKTLSLKADERFHTSSRDIDTLVALESAPQGDSYHFRNPVLSNRFLSLYSERYHTGEDNEAGAIYACTREMIRNMAALGRDIHEAHLQLLIFILIQNRKQKTSDQDHDPEYSALLEDIGATENMKKILQTLADSFTSLAEEIQIDNENGDPPESRRDRQVLQLISHAHGHLGRVYSKRDHNYRKASEEFELARQYMVGNDPSIYHMSGEARLDRLKGLWEGQMEPPSSELQAEIEKEVSEAMRDFEYAAEFGSPEFGYPSKLRLILNYLEYLFRVNHIENQEQVGKLKSAFELQNEFIDTLEPAKTFAEYDTKTLENVHDYEDKFRSKIMFGDYSTAMEYYQEQVNRLEGTDNIGGYWRALRNLVSTTIAAAKAEHPGRPFYETVANREVLIQHIETLLERPYDSKGSYSEYIRRTQLFRNWMQLAKILNRSVEDGISMAERWLDMEEQRRGNRNPEPYYYRSVLLYLCAQDGYTKALSEQHQLTRKISALHANDTFDRRWTSMRKTRDVFVKGTGMNRLFDVLHCSGDREILQEIALANCVPELIAGNFTSIQDPRYALVVAHDPMWFGKEKVWLDIGKGSKSPVGKPQIGHLLRFAVGFSVEHPLALSQATGDLLTDPDWKIEPILQELRQVDHDGSALRDGVAAAEARGAQSPTGADALVEVVLDSLEKNRAFGHEKGVSGRKIMIQLKNQATKDAVRKAYDEQTNHTVKLTGREKQGALIAKWV